MAASLSESRVVLVSRLVFAMRAALLRANGFMLLMRLPY
jgi:hypothetical protein